MAWCHVRPSCCTNIFTATGGVGDYGGDSPRRWARDQRKPESQGWHPPNSYLCTVLLAASLLLRAHRANMLRVAAITPSSVLQLLSRAITHSEMRRDSVCHGDQLAAAPCESSWSSGDLSEVPSNGPDPRRPCLSWADPVPLLLVPSRPASGATPFVSFCLCVWGGFSSSGRRA